MTRHEARKIAAAMKAWWMQSVEERTPWPPALKVTYLSAIDVLTQPSTIADNIRNAAINWPQFLGDVESKIIDSFCGRLENFNVDWDCCGSAMSAGSIEGRNFMLFVAEALES